MSSSRLAHFSAGRVILFALFCAIISWEQLFYLFRLHAILLWHLLISFYLNISYLRNGYFYRPH